jgi:hypothetical protein
MAASIPGMSILRQRPWLVALIAFVFGVVLRAAPWPLSIAGGLILAALTIWGLWAAWTHRRVFVRWFWAVRRRIIGAAVDDARIEAASAVRAAALDTVEADIQTSTTRAAWVSQIEYQQGLLDSPNHALTKTQRLASERLVRQLRRNVRDLDTAEGRPVSLATHGARPLAAFGPVAAATGFGPMWLWVSGAFVALAALLGLQSVRLENAKQDLREERADRAAAERALTVARNQIGDLADQLGEANDSAAASAIRTEQRERALRAARQREREFTREIQQRNRDVGEPPDWGLRSDGTVPGSTGAGTSGDQTRPPE